MKEALSSHGHPSGDDRRSRSSIEAMPIMADPTQIHQILMNLCTNAAHAMEERGGMLEVSLQDFLLRRKLPAATPLICSRARMSA